MPPTWPGPPSRREPAGVKLVIEPINHRDMPGYFLNTEAQGAAVVEAIGRDRLGLQFDVYHCQTTEGDITKRMEQLHAGDRAHADRRRAGAQRAGHRGDRLAVRVPADGRAWLRGLGRLRIPPGRQKRVGRPGSMAPSAFGRLDPAIINKETQHEDRIHRPRHHGPPHGAQPEQRPAHADRAGPRQRWPTTSAPPPRWCRTARRSPRSPRWSS